MATVVSEIKLNMPKLNRRNKAAMQALIPTAEALRTEVVQAQVVPRMDGALQGEKMYVDASHIQDGSVELVHEGPYARRLYYHPEYNFQKGPWEEDVKNEDGSISHLKHEGNPNAKGKWFEDWQPGGAHEDFIPKTLARLIGGEVKS